VLVVVGLLSALAVSQLGTMDVNLAGRTEVLKSHLRLAAARSMNSATVWGIWGDADSNSYWLFKDGNTDDKITLPAETLPSVKLDEYKVVIADFSVSFNTWGQPCSDSNGQTPVNDDMTIRLTTLDGTDHRDVIITAETGFIP
jgi:hypothetical protein